MLYNITWRREIITSSGVCRLEQQEKFLIGIWTGNSGTSGILIELDPSLKTTLIRQHGIVYQFHTFFEVKLLTASVFHSRKSWFLRFQNQYSSPKTRLLPQLFHRRYLKMDATKGFGSNLTGILSSSSIQVILVLGILLLGFYVFSQQFSHTRNINELSYLPETIPYVSNTILFIMDMATFLDKVRWAPNFSLIFHHKDLKLNI